MAHRAPAHLFDDRLRHEGRIEDHDLDPQLPLGPFPGYLHPGDIDDAVTVDEDEFIEPVLLQGSDDVAGDLDQDLRPDRDGAGQDHVVGAPAEPQGWRDHDICPPGGSIRQGVGDHGVGADRQVRAVLFGAAYREDDGAFGDFYLFFDVFPG